MSAGPHGFEPYSVSEATDALLGFVLAGHETTANLIGNLVWLLLTHPEQLVQVRENPDLVPAAVEEGLRFDTSVLGLCRTTTRQVEIAGTTVPAGAKLLVLYGSGNHDERRFPDAEEFRVSREGQSQHLAFGRGIHFCLGAPLARLEARIAVERLLARLPGLRLADPNTVPEQNRSHNIRGWESLPVEWDS